RGARLSAADDVPSPEDARVVLEGEQRERAGGEAEPRPAGGRELDPARAEHAQEVPVGEDRDGSRPSEQLRRDTVRAGADVRRLLAAGAAVAPQAPSRPLACDLRAREALVVAVVPLAEQLLALGALA